jgi:protein-S-isoprenylcysteine O-methyltransferase Ste14
VLALETARRRRLTLDLRFAPLAAAGFALYWLCGRYRRLQGAGGPGFRSLPVRLLTSGPYAYSRNPMYLGHLLFTLGLALTLPSPFAALLLAERWWRFSRRVQLDEIRLLGRFGDDYAAYTRRVKRWVPGLV